MELAHRLATALILAILLLATLFVLTPNQAALVFAALTMLAAWEWAGLMKVDAAARVMFAFVTALFCWQLWVIGNKGFVMFWLAAAIFWLLLAWPWLRRQWGFQGNDFVGYALGLVLLVATWSAVLALLQRGPGVLLTVMAIAWCSDIAAYFVGKKWGRNKLMPAVSPGKSWEGFWGGLAAVAVLSLVFVFLEQPFLFDGVLSKLIAVSLAILLAATGVLADLLESLCKRQAGVKDSSRLLPGHGGVLDRIDSQLAILPLAALLLQWSGR